MSTTPVLPYEVLDIVAQHLVGIGAFGTCANVNVASHLAHDATLKTLWTHLYWTMYSKVERRNGEDMFQRWESFVASAGARYVKYLIQPDLTHVMDLLNDFPALKASISLIKYNNDDTGRISVALHKAYGYSMADMDGLLGTLEFAMTTPGFDTVTEISMAILHSPLATAAQLRESVDVFFSPFGSGKAKEAGIHDTKARRLDRFAMLSSSPIASRLCGIGLDTEDSAALGGKDHAILTTHIMMLLRPYAMARLERNGANMEIASFTMCGLLGDSMLAITEAYARMCGSDPIYATIGVNLELQNFEDSDDEGRRGASEQIARLDRKQISELNTLISTIADNYKQAARTIPPRLLGDYISWNEAEWFCANVEMDLEKGELRTEFDYGHKTLINKVEKLKDVATTASGEGIA